MGFLLAKILLLVIVAALLGSLFTRWYLRRNMRNVTSEYAQMQVDGEAWRQSIEKLLAQRPQPDFMPLQKHLEKIETAIRGIPALIPAPIATDLRPVMQGIAANERSIKSMVFPVPQAVDLSAVQTRLDTLEQAVRGVVSSPATQVDLQPILQRLSEIDAHIQNAEAAHPDEPRVVPVSIVVSKAANPPSVRAGSRNLLSHAGFGAADNLQRMKGVKRVMEKMLHDIGVYYFWQIGEWTEADILHADAQLTEFHGRIQRDGWVAQAVELGRAPDAALKPATIGVAQPERSFPQTTEAESAAI